MSPWLHVPFQAAPRACKPEYTLTQHFIRVSVIESSLRFSGPADEVGRKLTAVALRPRNPLVTVHQVTPSIARRREE